MHTVSAFEVVKFAAGAALSTTSLTTGAAIDRQNYQSAILVGITGSGYGAPDSFTSAVKVQHCATSNGTYADYTSNETGAALTTLSTTGATTAVAVDLRGANRYVRVVKTNTFVNGTSPKTESFGGLILGGATVLPAA